MRVISLNLNGIRAASRKGLHEFLAEKDADIVCFQELKADISVLPEEIIDYNLYWQPAEKKGYSGVGILTKKVPDNIEYGMSVRVYDIEGRVLRVDYGELSVISVYIPSGSSGNKRIEFKMRFLRAFKTYIKKLLNQGRELIICGDYNIAHQEIDLKNWKTNQKTSGFLPMERDWLTGFLKLGLVDAYRQFIGEETASYSWWSLRTNARARNVGWRLDYQISSPNIAKTLKNAEIPMEPVLSDHAPVIMDYDLTI